MFDTLVSNLSKVESNYRLGIEISNEIFDCLKVNDIKSLPKHTDAQTECMLKLKSDKEQLRETVKKISETNRIENKDNRMLEILQLFPQSQKEELIDLSRNTCDLEVHLQRALNRNQDFLATMMSASEALMESAIDYNENELSESQLFLDEKF